ncbi:cysteine--tRNA ligase [Roseibium denhamense]|uniref:Cysteine--tRNA ligase n=1 Tax=Roseibium denhamense TaxID=76305 RepID=A0ABY1NUB3_9HYPH|nr:cysteine--tRNA ligase [Roseibium denhamense]MTI05465.1 cysteine--tRNA ligase [Roseibium denhamense]SMP18526.1 cysteinyl-tRNA synthetase [Roseibium denhamense]
MSAADPSISGTYKGLKLTNTLTRTKEEFRAIDDGNVRLYVCGPTVYDFAHIGNARPVIVFDVLFRLLRHLYGAENVTYARNITDVDDKINARALRDFPNLSLNDAIAKVTQKTADQFHVDIERLGVLEPDHEPRATQHIDGMIKMIELLIDKGHAYIAETADGGEVLFDTVSMPNYGGLSKRKLDEQIAGARVAVENHKKNPGDFVLWKLSSADEPGWDSPWGRGRPGWHIECSVMSEHHLGKVFDIHGGGLDLIFPHHENEIAQSCCANGTERMSNYWMHNGFVQVEGRKMSKSEGNFFTIHELLDTENFGGRKWPGEVLRLAMLMTHYKEPIDFSVRKLEEAENLLAKWPELIETDAAPSADVLDAMKDDLNSAAAIQALHGLAGEASRNPEKLAEYSASAALLGLKPVAADMSGVDETRIQIAINDRLEALNAKNWAEADRIRDELTSQGILLKDSKDSETGARVTTWDLKR